jgi:hypothetical protein
VVEINSEKKKNLLVPQRQAVVEPLPFAHYNEAGRFPIDVVQMDIYNDQDYYFESIPTVTNYSIQDNVAYVDIEQELKSQNYIAGDFRVRLRFLRNFLGTALGSKLVIQEVSRDRLEIRVVTTDLVDNEAENQVLKGFFSDSFFRMSKLSTLVNLYAFFTPTEQVGIVDYVQDKFTFTEYPYSIVFKLNEPLPLTKGPGDYLWIAQETSPPVTEDVLVVPPSIPQDVTIIAGPNFDAVKKTGLGVSTEYQSWDEMLQYSSQSLSRALFSQSLVEGIPLNVDYTRFENFVKFGSAYDRIKNFEYKVKLIENYYDVSASLATTNASESYYTQQELVNTQNKIDLVIGAFDGYERYMYFESSSYISSSLGIFLDMAWPKTTSTKPYTLYASNTPEAQTWLDGILSSASLYDNNNQESLKRLIPAHIQQDENPIVDSFVNMLGHYFDTQYEYINQLPKIYDRQEKLSEGFAKDIVFTIAQNLGVDFSNGQNFQNLWSYMLGFDASGSYDNALAMSGEDRTREAWKRIINNLPYLLKTKGTERGVRALINCFGIPSTILRIREYGGPEPDFDTQSTYDHDRFYYALKTNPNTTTLSTLWSGSAANYKPPIGIELRFKANSAVSQSSLVHWVDNTGAGSDKRLAVLVGRDSTGDYIEYQGNVSESVTAISQKLYVPTESSTGKLFDGKWVTMYLRRSGSYTATTTTGSYTLFAGIKSNYTEKPLIYSASWGWSGSSTHTSPSVGYKQYKADRAWYAGCDIVYVATGLYPHASRPLTSSFSGSLQELRFWGETPLQINTPSVGAVLCEQNGTNLIQSPFYAHIINPTSIVGQNYQEPSWTGATSSYGDLVYRQTLGTSNVKIDLYGISSVYQLSGSQPNKINTRISTFTGYTSITNSYWEPVVEKNYMPWPDLAGNRQVSNKIRVESTISTSEELFRNTKTQTSLQDAQPTDSPRLGVYLSPTDQVNEDIAEQFGGISIDDFIGSYSNIYEESYDDLKSLRREYLKKYSTKNNPQAYIRLLQHFNSAVFEMIKQVVPYRANLQTGLVIEPDILDRSKVKLASQPTYQDEAHETLIELPSVSDPIGDINDIDPGVIDADRLVPFAMENVTVPTGLIDGESAVGIEAPWQFGSIVTPNSLLNRYGNAPGTYENDTLKSYILTNGRDRIEGSQYSFYSWYETSGLTSTNGLITNSAGYAYVNSVNDDYWNPFGPTVYGNRVSEVALIRSMDGVTYDGRDIYNGTGSFESDATTYSITQPWVQQANTDTYGVLAKLGLRVLIETGSQQYIYKNASNPYWQVVGNTSNDYIRMRTFGLGIQTGSLWLNAFATNKAEMAPDYYDVSFQSFVDDPDVQATMSVWLGNSGSGNPITTIPITDTATVYSYKVLSPQNSDLYIEVRATETGNIGGRTVVFNNFVVQPYKYAQVQDYQVGPLSATGQRNQKYDGCKLTAADWNEDSSDTIDRGPVVTIIEGPGVDLNVDPNTNGTFTFR